MAVSGILRNVAILLTMATISFGCAATTPSSRYPDFPQQKKNIKQLAAIGDVVITHMEEKPLEKKNYVVDISECKRLGDVVLRLMSSGFRHKGCSIMQRHMSSVGATLNENIKCKVAGTTREYDERIHSLPQQSPPFFVSPFFSKQAGDRDKLISLYLDLANFKDGEKSKLKLLPDAMAIGKLLEADTLLVVSVTGCNVLLEKSIKDAVISSVLTLGFFSRWDTSQILIKLFIVDTQTGQMLWFDKEYLKGASVDQELLLRLANKLVERVPN
jgi:hypothetical protein